MGFREVLRLPELPTAAGAARKVWVVGVGDGGPLACSTGFIMVSLYSLSLSLGLGFRV